MTTENEKKWLDFTSEQEQEIVKAVALLVDVGVVVWRRASPEEADRSNILVGAALDLRIFAASDGEEITGFELAVYSDDGGDCAPITIPADLCNTFVPKGPTEVLPASPRVLKNIKMAEIAEELYPETFAKMQRGIKRTAK